MRSSKLPIFISMIALVGASVACALGGVSLSHFRVAFDKEGDQPTSTYAATDVFHAVAELSNAPVGTKADVKWYAINAAGLDPNALVAETNLVINEEGINYVTFELSNPDPWGVGDYKVEYYLNGAQVGTVNFNVK